MDWMLTNHSQQQDWVNRPKLSDYTYADSGGTCAFQFSDIGTYGKFGCWGALETVKQATSPKWQALQNTMKLWGQI